MTIRTRSLPMGGSKVPSRYWRVNNNTGNTTTEIFGSYETDGTQTTVSFGHRWPPLKRGFHGDIGGPFTTVRSYIEGEALPSVTKVKGRTNIGGNSTEYYTGYCFAQPQTTTGHRKLYPPPDMSTDSQLDAIGATAVARCKPTNSASDLGVFFGELMKEGLPSLTSSHNWQNRNAVAKAAGDDYLNLQFGWRPFLSEIDNFLKIVGSSHTALQQLRRDDTRLVRRRYEFPVDTQVTEATVSSAPNTIAGLFGQNNFLDYNGTPNVRKVETERRRWFSGAFRYFLPDSLKGESGISDLVALAQTQFGLTITPELLWNLAPWSWAVDWFSNAGDVISNVTDSQRYGLIMPYGYMMEHTITRYTYSAPGYSFKNNGGGVPPLTVVTECKKRRAANPFGFGVTDTSLNPFQLSILAALGLSRSR